MDRIDLADLVVDFRREQVVARDGRRLGLRPRSFAVLRHLATRVGELVTKDDLLAACWPNVVVTEDSLTQCISEIRRLLGEQGRDLIRTVPRRGYVLALPEAAASVSAAVPIDPAGPPRMRGLFWQPIAVLPFDEFGTLHPDFAGLGAGFAEDLTTELARNRHIGVVARQSAFAVRALAETSAEIALMLGVRYVVEGSIRQAGTNLIVNVQLIDGRDSRHVWAERCVAPTASFFAMQDDLLARLVTGLFDGLCQAEQIARLACEASPSNAYELTMQAIAHLNQFGRRDLLLAHAALERALELDPTFATAYGLKGLAAATDAGLAISGAYGPDALPQAEATIRRGLELNPASPVGYRALSYALALRGAYEEGLAAAEHGLALAPHDAGSLAFLSMAQTAAARYGPALANAERARAQSSVPPATYAAASAAALYALSRYEEARQRATLATERSPGYTIAHAIGAAADMACGRSNEAEARIRTILRLSPGFGLRAPRVRTIYGSDRDLSGRFIEALEGCGLPDHADSAAVLLLDGL